MTAGLSVPADSKPSPCGATIGSGESRFHSPKGGVNWAAACVAIATTARNETTQALVNPLMKFSDLVMLEMSLLTGELDNVIAKSLFLFWKTARQNSAAICTMARAGACKLWPTIFPFSLRRTFLPSAGGIVMVAERTSAV